MGELLDRYCRILAWGLPMAVAVFGAIYGGFHRMHPFPAYCFIVAGVLSLLLNGALLLWQRTRDSGRPKGFPWIFYLGIVAGIGWILGGGAFLGWF